MRLPALALLLFTLPAAVAAAAPPAHDVARRDAWKPGDVVTTTTREERYREIRLPAREEELGPSKPQRLTSSVVAVERCEETDLEGNKTRSLVHLATWAFDNGTTKDESLQGALVEVTGRGTSRSHRLVGARTAPSKPAAAWLAREFGPGKAGEEAARRAWLPKVPVSVGDEWGADLPALLEGLTGADKLDRARAKGTARLVSVEGGVAKMALSASLPLTAFPAGKSGAPMPWTKGGAYAWKGTLAVGLEGRLPATRLETSGTLEGEAGGEGKTVAILFKLDRVVERSVGGAFPDPATIPPPPSDAPPATPPGAGDTPPK